MKNNLLIILAFSVVTLLGSVFALSTPIYATAKEQINKGITAAGGTDNNNLETSVKDIINVMLFAVGLLSVIVIIVSGIMFVTSAGNADTVKKAKSALTYSIIGVVVSILAYAIVNFVVNTFGYHQLNNVAQYKTEISDIN